MPQRTRRKVLYMSGATLVGLAGCATISDTGPQTDPDPDTRTPPPTSSKTQTPSPQPPTDGGPNTGKQGVITVRIVEGESLNGDTIVGVEDLFFEEFDPDTTPERTFNPAYRQYFSEDSPITVSQSDHQELQQEFDRVVYALGHSCPNAACSTPRVTRQDFNSVAVGEEVRLRYSDSDATATLIT